jgi:hypothetical protein
MRVRWRGELDCNVISDPTIKDLGESPSSNRSSRNRGRRPPQASLQLYERVQLSASAIHASKRPAAHWGAQQRGEVKPAPD